VIGTSLLSMTKEYCPDFDTFCLSFPMRIHLFLSLFFLISCSGNPEATNVIQDSSKKDSVQSVSKNIPDSSSENKIPQWPTGLPIDINALKKQYGTRGLLSSVSSKGNLSCDNDSVKGFFGEYYFIDSFSMKNFNNKNTLKVFKPGSSGKWMMEATDERFVSITLKNPCIKLWDSLHVGMPVKNFPAELIACKQEGKPVGMCNEISYKDENGIITEIYVGLLCRGAIPIPRK
jgi:hypothetical protein